MPAASITFEDENKKIMGIYSNIDDKTIERKLLSFEYSLISLIDWYVEIEKEKDKEKYDNYIDFFIDNNFSFAKVNLLPYFLCIGSNGNKEKMFKLFNHFFALEFGLVELDINKQIQEKGLLYFLPEDKSLSVKKTFFEDFGESKFNSITLGFFVEKVSARFPTEDINDLHNDLKEIDKTISHLKNNNHLFIVYPATKLSALSQSTKSWFVTHNLRKFYLKQESEIEIISLNLLQEDMLTI